MSAQPDDPVDKLETLFRGAPPVTRLEMGLAVLYASKPLELRLLASVLEDLASPDAVNLHHAESTANNTDALRLLMRDKGAAAAHHMASLIPLLHRDALASAELIASCLCDPAVHHSDDVDWCEQCTTCLHMALAHPAFGVRDKMKMHELLFKVTPPQHAQARVSSFRATVPGTTQMTSSIPPPEIVPTEAIQSVTLTQVRPDAKREYGASLINLRLLVFRSS